MKKYTDSLETYWTKACEQMDRGEKFHSFIHSFIPEGLLIASSKDPVKIEITIKIQIKQGRSNSCRPAAVALT